MDKLKELLSRCKCGVFVSVNQHRGYYQTAAEAIEELYSHGGDPEIADDTKARMIETDNIVEVQFYPDTLVGSYSIYHHDLEMALDEALACLDCHPKRETPLPSEHQPEYETKL